MSEIGEVEGEVVDANAIETALKTAGVALRNANGEFRNFDDVILELSSKWESLDVMTQRYIQTTQAGSRQQSRFLALMSNNERLTELVGYANNAAGASNQQYEKTLESLEAKINNLNNAMDIFWTNLANSDVIKGAIDLLTKLLNAINGITNGLTQSSNKAANFMGTLAQLGIVVAGFAGGKKILKGGVEKIGGWFLGQGKNKADIAGAEDGGAYQEGFVSGFKKKGGILGIFKEQKENISTFLKDAKKFGQDFQTAWKQGVYSKGDFSEGTNALFEKQNAIKEQQGEDSQQYKDQLKLAEDAGNKEIGLGGSSVKTAAILKGLFGGKESRAAAVKGLGLENMLTGKVMTALPLGYAAIAAAVTVGAAKAWDQLEVTTDEKLEEVNRTIDQFQDSISQANEKITDLKSSRSTLQGLNDDFNSLVKGSTEWKEKLVEVNQQVLSLINKYPELAQYIERGSQGQMTISEQGWNRVLEEQIKLNSIQQTALGSQRAQQYSLNNQKYAEAQMLQGGKGDRSQTVVGVDSLAGAAGLQTAAFINPIVGTIIAGFAVGDIIAKLVSGKTLTGRIAEAVDKTNAGASTKQYQIMLENMGEKGLGLQDVEALRKEFQKVTEGTGNFDIFYNNLRAMGDNLETVTKESYANKLQQEGQRQAILSNIIANNEYLSAQDKLINQMEGAAERLVNVDVDEKTLEKALGADLYKSEDGKIKDALKREYASIMSMTIDEVNAKLNDKSLSEDTMARVIYAKRQENDLAANMKKTADTLNKLKKSTDKTNYNIAKNILGNEGLDLTAGQIQTLEQLGELSEETVNKFFEAMGISVEDLGTTVETVIKNVQKAQEADSGILDRAEKLGVKAQMEAAKNSFAKQFPNMSVGSQLNLQNQILNAYENNGADLNKASEVIGSIINDIISNQAGLSQEEQSQALALIKEDSLTTVTGIQNLNSGLKAMGIQTELTVADIVAATRALNDVNLSSVLDTIIEVQTAIEKTTTGQQWYDEKQAQELGLDSSNSYTKKVDGETRVYYTGNKTPMELQEQYRKNEGFLSTILDNYNNQQGVLDAQENEWARLRKQASESGGKALSLSSPQIYSGQQKEFQNYRSLVEYQNVAMQQQEKENPSIYAQRDNKNLINNTRKYLTDLFGEEVLTSDYWLKNYSLTIGEEDYSDDFIARILYARENLFPLLGEQTITNPIWQQYKQDTVQAEQAASAYQTAKENFEAQKESFTQQVQGNPLSYTYSLISSGEYDQYENFSNEFYKHLLSSADSAGISQELQQTLREAINSSEPIDTDLVNSVIEAIDEKEAAQKLGDKLSSIASKVDVVDKITDTNVKENYMSSIVDSFFGLNSANLEGNEEKIKIAFENLRAAAEGGYKNFVEAVRLSLGSETTFIDENGIITDYDTNIANAIFNAKAQGMVEATQVAGKDIQIGQYIIDEAGVITKVIAENLAQYTSSKAQFGIAKIKDQQNFLQLLADSGIGNQNSKWEASYDWLYNLTKKMNKELRERNKLEKEENNILDARITTVADLLDNINEQKQSLLQSLSYENERYTKRQRELAHANKTAQNKGISQYVWMDKNNTVQINYDEIREVTDSAKGQLIQQMVEEYEFLQSEFENIEDNQDEYTSALKEIKTKYLQDSITLENELIEAIHTDRQKQIDKLSEINSSINDANSRMMDKISQGVTDIRNAREDDKSLKNIQEMEQRLALLRTDTSGANALEILSLEEQLNDARTSYADTQVDRAIDEMTRQNDEAAQQREWQIQLLEDQLEADREYGILAAQANELIRAALMDGSESQANTIKEILNKASDSQSLGYYGQQDFFDTMQDKVVKGIAGAVLSASPEYGQTVNFVDKNGNLIENGIAQADGSVFAGGKYYTNVFGFEDSTGNFSYMQHQTGNALSQGVWEQQTGLKANTGKVDLVKVSESTLGEVKAIRNILDKNYEKEQKIQEANKILDNYAKSTAGSPNGRQGNAIIALRKIFGTDTEMVSYLKNSGLSEDQLELFLSIINSLNSNNNNSSNRTGSSITGRPNGIWGVRQLKYATGGLNTTTGPAWLDGTKTAPEYVLNAEQTKAFLSLVNSLTSYSATSTPLGNNYYNVQIEVDQLANDYDVEQLMNKMKRVIADDALYRNVNAVDLGRR